MPQNPALASSIAKDGEFYLAPNGWKGSHFADQPSPRSLCSYQVAESTPNDFRASGSTTYKLSKSHSFPDLLARCLLLQDVDWNAEKRSLYVSVHLTGRSRLKFS